MTKTNGDDRGSEGERRVAFRFRMQSEAQFVAVRWMSGLMATVHKERRVFLPARRDTETEDVGLLSGGLLS